MKKILLVMVANLICGNVFANEFAANIGFRSQSGSISSSGAGAGGSAKSQTGIEGGVIGIFDFAEKMGLRTGFMYVQRPLSLSSDAGLGDAKFNLNYFDVPLQFSYNIGDVGSLFIGPVVSVNLDSNSSGTGIYNGVKMTSIKSTVFPLQIGASFKFASQLGATVYFETIPGEVAQDFSSYRAVGALLFVSFE